MDTARGISDRIEEHDAYDDTPAGEDLIAIGTDERRMHVRAYNYWVSLLGDRPYPSIEDLNPGNIADFGSNSVLLDFSEGMDNPAIRFLGQALRTECDVDSTITHVSQVPSRSLLSRLTDHYLQIIANRAPIGFEAEFVSQRGHNTLYRGILMPFSSNADTIDFIYGVINWKELVDAETQAKLDHQLAEARRTAPAPSQTAPVWADGPGTAIDSEDTEAVDLPDVGDAIEAAEAAGTVPTVSVEGLSDRLALARETAAAVRAADTRSRAALYRALGRAYDFALATEADTEGYAELLDDAGLKVQARAPMTPVVKLVFGSDYDKARVTEFAAALGNARRNDVGAGDFTSFIEAADGGLKALVRAERAARRPAAKPDKYAAAAAELRSRPPLANLPMGAGDAEFVVLLARRADDNTLDVVARVDAGAKFTAQVVRRAAA